MGRPPETRVFTVPTGLVRILDRDPVAASACAGKQKSPLTTAVNGPVKWAAGGSNSRPLPCECAGTPSETLTESALAPTPPPVCTSVCTSEPENANADASDADRGDQGEGTDQGEPARQARRRPTGTLAGRPGAGRRDPQLGKPRSRLFPETSRKHSGTAREPLSLVRPVATGSMPPF